MFSDRDGVSKASTRLPSVGSRISCASLKETGGKTMFQTTRHPGHKMEAILANHILYIQKASISTVEDEGDQKRLIIL